LVDISTSALCLKSPLSSLPLAQIDLRSGYTSFSGFLYTQGLHKSKKDKFPSHTSSWLPKFTPQTLNKKRINDDQEILWGLCFCARCSRIILQREQKLTVSRQSTSRSALLRNINIFGNSLPCRPARTLISRSKKFLFLTPVELTASTRRDRERIGGGKRSLLPCLGDGFFFLIVVIFVEIVNGLFSFFDGLLFLLLGNFFSPLDLKVSLFAPLSGMLVISHHLKCCRYLMTSGSSCRGIVIGAMGEVAILPKPFYRQSRSQ